MAILCLGRSIKIDFADWLADSEQDLYLVTSAVMPHQDRYRIVQRLPDLDQDGATELACIELGRGATLTHILPHSEYDLIRAARLRQYFGVPGQSVDSALAYRDKVLMKEYLAQANIPVAHCRRVVSPLDALEFAETHGFPLIWKPVNACSSKGVRKVDNMASLYELLRMPWAQETMVETYVEGRMFHVNGVIHHGIHLLTAPCAYINGALDYQQAGIFGTRIIAPDSVLAERLIAFTKRVIAALPPADPLGYHAEIFLTPSNELVLCEIAARTAGSLTGELIAHSYGVNIHQTWIRAMAELPLAHTPHAHPALYAASLRVPTRAARLDQLPLKPKLPGLSTFCVSGRVDTLYQTAATYTDDVLSAIVVGHSEPELTDRIGAFIDWAETSIHWR